MVTTPDHSIASFPELLDEVREALVAISLDGHILAWNRGAEAIFGYPRNEAIGQHAGKLLFPTAHINEILSMIGPRGLVMSEPAAAHRHQLTAQHRDGAPLRIDLSLRLIEADQAASYVAMRATPATPFGSL